MDDDELDVVAVELPGLLAEHGGGQVLRDVRQAGHRVGERRLEEDGLEPGGRVGDPPDLFGRPGVGGDHDAALAVVDHEAERRHEVVDGDRRDPEPLELDRLAGLDLVDPAGTGPLWPTSR